MDEKFSFRVEKLVFRPSLPVTPETEHALESKVIVFIGPNNSGKSRALKEIRSEILGHIGRDNSPNTDYSKTMFETINLKMPKNTEEFEAAYNLSEHVIHAEWGWMVRDYCNTEPVINPQGRGFHQPNRHPVFSSHGNWKNEFDRCLKNQDDPVLKETVLRFVGPMLVDYAGTDDRLLLTAGDLARGIRDNDYNLLSSVLDIDADCTSFSSDLKRMFARDVVLDATTSRQVVIPVSSDDFDEYRKSSSKNRLKILSERATPRSQEGDGLHSFVSVLLNLEGREKPIFLLDEPEAFLYPPQALKMGSMLSERFENAKNLEQAFVSTHSSYLLRGLLSSETLDVSIIRFGRRGSERSIHEINREALQNLFDRSDFTPLYIDGLFSSEVILVESPGDEALYSKIISRKNPLYDGLFIPINGKDRFAPMMEFYLSAGIPCKVIADFDILNNHNLFKNLLRAANIPRGERSIYLSARDKLEEEYRNLCNKPGKPSDKLPDEVRTRYKKDVRLKVSEKTNTQIDILVAKLARHGIAIIRNGEMESLFESIEGLEHSHTEGWLLKALDYVAKTQLANLERNESVRHILKAVLEAEPKLKNI